MAKRKCHEIVSIDELCIFQNAISEWQRRAGSGSEELVQGVNNGCKQVESSITSLVYVQFISNLAC